MTERPKDVKAGPGRRLALIAAAFVAAAGAALAGIYGIASLQGNAVDAACKPAASLAARLTPLMRGEVAALTPAKSPLHLNRLAFRDAAGAERSLGEWKDRTVLLNLWATWCVPCKKEMPALDALQKKLGGPQFEVVAVNIDTRDPQKPKDWLKETGVNGLAFYADPSARIFQDLKAAGRAFGMPTTLLVDRNGCEIATLAGPAEWASEDAVKLIEAALKP
jgi:thiol-disulfide isomerase/thioredoxin